MSPRINPGINDSSIRPVLSKPADGVALVAKPVSQNPVSIQPADPIASRPISASEQATSQAENTKIQIPQSFIRDVQQIASQSGFVGLTPSAIQRAYYQGESLFVNVSA